MIWNDIQKRFKKENEEQCSIFWKTRGQKERKTAVKVLYTEREPLHFTNVTELCTFRGCWISVSPWTSDVLPPQYFFFFSFLSRLHLAFCFSFDVCFKTDWTSACFIAPLCSLNQTFSLSTCHKRAFWVFIISHMSKQCRLSYRFEPTVEVCSPPQCSCREARTSRFWTRSQILFESFTRPFFLTLYFSYVPAVKHI